MQNESITKMSDPDFLSFLYAERERENSLSVYHGWNNWVLMAALGTIVSTLYLIVRDNIFMTEMRQIMYYVSGIMGYFFTYRSCVRFFQRPRGVDYTRVRMLKNVAPFPLVALILVVSSVMCTCIALIDTCTLLFYLWGIVLLTYIAYLIYVIKCGNKPVLPYVEEDFFQKVRPNIIFAGITGGLFGLIGGISFRMASSNILNVNFEVGLCASLCSIMLYWLAKVNIGNQTIRQFDLIVDDYLYKGKTKEETYRKILRNRMGCDIFDACEDELAQIIGKLNEFERNEGNKIEKYIEEIEKTGCPACTCKAFADAAVDWLDSLEDILDASERLSKRIDEIVKVNPDIIGELYMIFDVNKTTYARVKYYLGIIRRRMPKSDL